MTSTMITIDEARAIARAAGEAEAARLAESARTRESGTLQRCAAILAVEAADRALLIHAIAAAAARNDRAEET